MRRNDLKNALNEIQLSKSFCEKMEQKLADADFANDEYFDEVVHVDVVRKRSSKSFAAAAALVLALGVGGTGTAVIFKDKIASTFDNDEDTEDEDFDGEGINSVIDDEHVKYEYPFLFGTIDLNGINFYYNYIYQNKSAIVTEEKARELQEFFTTVEWTTVENDNTEKPSQQENVFFVTGDKKYIVYFFSDGNVTTYYNFNGGDELYPDYYVCNYEIPVEKYKELKKLMFSDIDSSYIKKFGAKADLEGAYFRLDRQEGTISYEQAIDVANLISVETEWTLLGEDTEVAEDDTSMNINFRSEGEKWDIEFYNAQDLIVVNESSDKDELISRRVYKPNIPVFDSIRKIIGNGIECESPVNFSNTDQAFVEYYHNGKWNGYNVDGEWLDKLTEVSKEMEWKSPYRAIWTPYKNCIDFREAVVVNAGNKRMLFYDNGGAAYGDLYTLVPFTFNGFETLQGLVEEINSEPLNTSEFMYSWVSNALDSEHLSFSNDGNGKFLFTDEEKNAIKNKFKELEWEECPDENNYHIMLDERYGVCPTFVLSSSVRYSLQIRNEFFMITEDGIITGELYKWGYKCKDTTALFEFFDELLQKK